MKRQNGHTNYNPPKLALTFLNWFCAYYLLEEIEGDLVEKFEYRKETHSQFLNQLLFCFGVLGFFRPIFWRKNLFYYSFGGIDMFRSNLKFAVRNLYKNFFFSTINITGLALGIACVLFIFFYVQHELSYDSYNEKGERIFRVVTEANINGNELNSSESGWCVAPTMKKDFPEVESFVRFNSYGMNFVKNEDKVFKENNILVADSNFFDLFSIDIMVGNPDQMLKTPNIVAISNSTAEKYFGINNPVGKTLIFNNKDTLSVSGVYEDIPLNTHFKADFIISKPTFNMNETGNWSNLACYTFVLLNEKSDPASLQAKMPLLTENYFWPEAKKYGVDADELKANGFKWDFVLQPIQDIHINPFYSTVLSKVINIKYIYVFVAIAIFILLIASINFINLSTAKSASRAKEVGIKKVVGSFRSDLIVQFLTESVVISIISFLIAVGLIAIFKQFFFDAIGSTFPISYWDNIGFVFAMILIILFTGILAGSFPAFVLSKFNPTLILRGGLKNVMQKGKFRSSLVVFQFTASLIMIIGTFVIFEQITFMREKDLGFDKEHLLTIDDIYILGNKSQIFADRMLEHTNVKNGTVTGYLPIESYRANQGFFKNGDVNAEKGRTIQRWRIDENYFSTLGIKILKGRNFSKDRSTDKEKIIVNKACADYFEFEDPLKGKLGRGSEGGSMLVYDIIGVVDNFHFKSVKQQIEPIVFFLEPHSGSATFKIQNNITQVVEYAESIWQEFAPGQPFSFRFMDESFDNVYKSETDMLNLFQYFSVIAVLIGCLGLFALSAYTVERRTKEIGIRKVMGAKTLSLVFQLTKEFSLLVIISLVIASPIAYYLMEKWLADYATRIQLGIGVFLISGGLALLVAILTISFHAIKASLMNPVKSIRYE